VGGKQMQTLARNLEEKKPLEELSLRTRIILNLIYKEECLIWRDQILHPNQRTVTL
jgi:hypothetical protein